MALATKIIHHAKLADLQKLPPTWRGEIIDDTLYAALRPLPRHASVEGLLLADLTNPFQRGRGGPGGWWILPEPGIHIPRAPEFSPDVAAWRRERLPRLPQRAPITLVPDWIGEVLAPSTATYDQTIKRRFYADIGVNHLWYVDPQARSLEVSRLLDGEWEQLGLYCAGERFRAEPFEAVEMDLSAWWEGLGGEER